MLRETEDVHGFIPSRDLCSLRQCPDYFGIRVFLQEENGKACTLTPIVGAIPSHGSNSYFVEKEEWQRLIAYAKGKLLIRSAAYNLTMYRHDPASTVKNSKPKKRRRVTRVVIRSYKHGIKRPLIVFHQILRSLQINETSSEAQAKAYIVITLVLTREPAYVTFKR